VHVELFTVSLERVMHKENRDLLGMGGMETGFTLLINSLPSEAQAPPGPSCARFTDFVRMERVGRQGGIKEGVRS